MILLTGATGYLGKKLLKELSSDQKVIVPVRSRSGLSGSERLEADLNRANIQVIESDLQNLGEAQLDLNNIEVIIHNAAVTAFNVDEETANKVNRDGSRNIFELASRCPNLKKIIYVSTVYSSGMKAGEIEESLCDNLAGFANHYERSKWEAETLLTTEFGHLPWCIARVSTVISDDSAGNVIQQNAVHNTLKLFFYGLISLLPGNPNTPIYLVTGDFVTRALKVIIEKGDTQKVYHVTFSLEESLTLGKIIELAHASFLEDEGFKTKRILKPLFTDMSSFETLVDNVKHFGGAILSQGVTSVAPFGKQLFIPKIIKNDELKKLMGKDYPEIDMNAVITNACRTLVKNKFSLTESFLKR